MRSLEQIQMMNADPPLKQRVEQYGWKGGNRVLELELALDKAAGTLSRAADAIVCHFPDMPLTQADGNVLSRIHRALRTAREDAMVALVGETAGRTLPRPPTAARAAEPSPHNIEG